VTYRQSSFDPSHGEPARSGPPLRPFDRWQWLGVVSGLLGIAVVALFIAQTMDAVHLPFEVSGPIVFIFCLSGNFLLQRDPELAPGTLDPRRRWSLVGLVVALAILAVDVAL
jgi:hypothetical protein